MTILYGFILDEGMETFLERGCRASSFLQEKAVRQKSLSLTGIQKKITIKNIKSEGHLFSSQTWLSQKLKVIGKRMIR